MSGPANLKKKVQELEKRIQQLEVTVNEFIGAADVASVRFHPGLATDPDAALVAGHIAVNNQSANVSTAASSSTVQPAPKGKAASALHRAELSEKLIKAFEKEDLDDVRKLLTNGADVAYRSPSDGLTVLHRAVIKRSVSLTVLFLDAGAPLETGSDQGRTPLHYAAEKGPLRIVQVLVACGANVNAHDKNGNSPLFYARDPGYERVLLDAGADPSLLNIAHDYYDY